MFFTKVFFCRLWSNRKSATKYEIYPGVKKCVWVRIRGKRSQVDWEREREREREREWVEEKYRDKPSARRREWETEKEIDNRKERQIERKIT